MILLFPIGGAWPPLPAKHTTTILMHPASCFSPVFCVYCIARRRVCEGMAMAMAIRMRRREGS